MACWNRLVGTIGSAMVLCAVGLNRTYTSRMPIHIVAVSQSLRPVVPAKELDLHERIQLQSDPHIV